jgi:hypothetical protein
MINYLRHNEIDHEQWDDCIKDSPRVKPYGFSWYLDIMSPGWEALTDDDYDAVFPIPAFKKYGIEYRNACFPAAARSIFARRTPSESLE